MTVTAPTVDRSTGQRSHARVKPARSSPAPLKQARSRTYAAFGLAAALLLGFACYLYGLSGQSESRFQHNSYKSFTRSLGQAIAPVGATKSASPVAVLSIPRLGIVHVVVVEGTGARELTKGPGHRRDTPLPGQAGVSVVYGRVALFGAPFAHLMRLQTGDKITATTGQGVAVYVVSSFGDGSQPAPANSANRLVLTTADSATTPRSTVSVSADLSTPAQPGPAARAAIGANERAMSNGLDASIVTLLLWSQLLALLAVLATLAAHYWSPAPAYLCLAPILLAVLWNVYENAATLLPNVY